MPPVEHVVPAAWVVATASGAVGAICAVLWRLMVWGRNQVSEVFAQELHGDKFQKHVERVVADAFAGHAAEDAARAADTSWKIESVRERIEQHEALEKHWHEDTRRAVERGSQDAATNIMRLAGDWIRERDAKLRDHEVRIVALERKQG